MSLGDVSLAHAGVLVDELVNRGMAHACISPGSRSTPLALALERDPRVQTHIHLDERSSAFFGLGIAKVTRRPVGVVCTSGTAAAEFFPAVVEACQSRAPLVLMTADRPPRLRGTGANQTIDQTALYGRYASYVELPLPEEPVAGGVVRSLVAAGFAEASRGGPVHVNVPFDEPLMPEGEVVGVDEITGGIAAPAVTGVTDADERGVAAAEEVARAIDGTNGVIMVAALPDGPLRQVLSLAETLGWPVIAEPLSGCRVPLSAGGATVLRAGQSLLADKAWLREHIPQTVLQVGATPITRASQGLVAAADRRIVVDRHHLDPDPEGRATIRVHEDPDVFATALLSRAAPLQGAAGEWLWSWRDADVKARAALDAALDSGTDPFEPRIARDLVGALPAGATFFVGSSMPVRDLDLAMAPRANVRILGNRGASGIDGFLSTALGAAALTPETGSPVYALMGDLTFVYDAGALLWLARRGLDAVITVLDNGGGGIFGLLAQRDLPEHERLFTTAHGLDLQELCDAAGAGYQPVDDAADYVPSVHAAEQMGGVVILHVTVDPARAVRRRRVLSNVVATALGG